MKKLLALALVLVMMLSLVACPTPPVVEDEVVLRMATGYNNTKTGITFTADSGIKEEGLTLADGKTYFTGDLKPTWAALEEILKVKFEDKFTGAGSAEKAGGRVDGRTAHRNFGKGLLAIGGKAGELGMEHDLDERGIIAGLCRGPGRAEGAVIGGVDLVQTHDLATEMGVLFHKEDRRSKGGKAERGLHAGNAAACDEDGTLAGLGGGDIQSTEHGGTPTCSGRKPGRAFPYAC